VTVELEQAPPDVIGRCRAWPLVAHPGRLTSAEREAGDLHLTLCRRCRTALDDAARVRRTAAVGAGTVGAVAAASSGAAVTGTTAATTGSALAGGHGVVGLVIGGALAAAAAGGVAVVATHSDHRPSTRPQPSTHAPVATTPPSTPGTAGSADTARAGAPAAGHGTATGPSGITTPAPAGAAPAPTPTDVHLPTGATVLDQVLQQPLPTVSSSLPAVPSLPTVSPTTDPGIVVGTVTDLLPAPTLAPTLP
jgi:hypothetical protein